MAEKFYILAGRYGDLPPDERTGVINKWAHVYVLSPDPIQQQGCGKLPVKMSAEPAFVQSLKALEVPGYYNCEITVKNQTDSNGTARAIVAIKSGSYEPGK